MSEYLANPQEVARIIVQTTDWILTFYDTHGRHLPNPEGKLLAYKVSSEQDALDIISALQRETNYEFIVDLQGAIRQYRRRNL